MNFYLRNRNTNLRGSTFDQATIQAVWEQGMYVPGYNPSFVRKDTCGAIIHRQEYGNTNSQYGWEIDHIDPVSNGGDDRLSNLQPLHWENNRHKSDNFPEWSCKKRW